MSQYLIADIEQTPNIQVQCGVEVVAVHGEDKLESLTISLCANGIRREGARDVSLCLYRRGAADRMARRLR